MGFVRMDQGKDEDWTVIARGVARWQSLLPKRIKSMLLQLAGQSHGFEVNQLQHSLQTATRALRDKAPEEMIVAALCHDIGTAISTENHSAIAAEILKPYVSPEVYEIVRTHQDFQRSHYHVTVGRDPQARKQYSNESWYMTACRFSDEWDQTSFDPDYDNLPLEHFEPMIDRIFSSTRNGYSPPGGIYRRGWLRVKQWIKPRAHRGQQQ
jgi:predicted HD phosphohydrolase